jgi:hypothetical protein
VKRLERETNNSPPSGAEVKDEYNDISAEPICLCDVDMNNLAFACASDCTFMDFCCVFNYPLCH